MNISTGYGTYITAGLVLATVLAHSFKLIDDATFQSVLATLGAGGATFLRAAISKSSATNATNAAVIANQVGVPPETVQAVIKPPPAVPPASLV